MKMSLPASIAAVMLLTGSSVIVASEGTEHGSGMQSMHQSMQQSMERIRETEDPEERDRLLEKHMEQMTAAMRQMHENMGVMMEQMDAQKRETRKTHNHRKMRGG